MGHVRGVRAVRESMADFAAAAAASSITAASDAGAASSSSSIGGDGGSAAAPTLPTTTSRIGPPTTRPGTGNTPAAATPTPTLSSRRGPTSAVSATSSAAPTPLSDPTVGVLAVQLGELGAAAKLFSAAGRPDLLTRLYADSGVWDRALAQAATADR